MTRTGAAAGFVVVPHGNRLSGQNQPEKQPVAGQPIMLVARYPAMAFLWCAGSRRMGFAWAAREIPTDGWQPQLAGHRERAAALVAGGKWPDRAESFNPNFGSKPESFGHSVPADGPASRHCSPLASLSGSRLSLSLPSSSSSPPATAQHCPDPAEPTMADETSPAKQHNAARPQLSTSMRSSSYLSDHQQYRPPRQTDQFHGIDTVVEDFGTTAISSPKKNSSFNGIPSEENPPTIVDSGLSHSYSHPNCAPLAGHKTDRLIATLFYKTRGDAAANGTGARSPVKDPSESHESLPVNLAPTIDMEEFPLEPPTQDGLEQLDHIYGSYISPLCITSFLHLMSTFPMPRDSDEPHSSHRCLDNQENPRIVELALTPVPSEDYLTLDDLRKHEMIYRFEREWNVDVIFQKDTVWRRHPRLVVFDMDSTLITQEVIDLLADHIKDPPNLAARVAEITHRAMMGELEFEASFKERVALLKGLPATLFKDLQPVLNVTPGTFQLIRALKRLGVKTAVLSGGFQPLTGWLAKELGIDYAHANDVVIENERLTGETQGIIVGKERKRDLLLAIAEREGIDLSQVVAVGDGANDLLMMSKAALGVAWNAKPLVQMEADARLNGESLLDLLYLFGFTGEEIEVLIS
ncbi:hypothetical protein G7046_g4532 [Stylonectria norvegica]|nr:hypothetical protein G7046_g4532 [Stylonectria norvegica]